MKFDFNKYWIIVSFLIIINIILFINMSKMMETFVINHIVDTQVIN